MRSEEHKLYSSASEISVESDSFAPTEEMFPFISRNYKFQKCY